MSLLFDSWFPAGGQLADWSQYDAMGSVGVSPVVAIDQHIDLVHDTAQGTVARVSALLSDPLTAGGTRTEILPLAPANGAPIADWEGSEDSRRWYHFRFMVQDWRRETSFSATPQFTVVWQVHDDPDTSPADVALEPPMWLIDNGYGWWQFVSSYDANAQSSASTYTKRVIAAFSITNGKWEDIVVRAKWSWTDGEIDIWRDRRQIARYRATPNCFNNLAARGGGKNYMKLGCYRGTSSFDRTVYHCGAQIGDETYEGFASFASACGIGSELESFPITMVCT